MGGLPLIFTFPVIMSIKAFESLIFSTSVIGAKFMKKITSIKSSDNVYIYMSEIHQVRLRWMKKKLEIALDEQLRIILRSLL
jgi:hypothetical protein